MKTYLITTILVLLVVCKIHSESFSLALEKSSDLNTWTVVPISSAMLSSEGRIVVDKDIGVSSAFFRLKITETPTPTLIPPFTYLLTAEGSNPAFAEDGVYKINIISPDPYNYADTVYYNAGGTAIGFNVVTIYVDGNFRSFINYTSDREGTSFGYRSSGGPSSVAQFTGIFADNADIYFITPK
jgi:hypothetical protein